MRPHRWQPTRLLHPRDSPGKNTGVGCHFLLQCMKESESEVAQPCPALSDPLDCSPLGSSVHGILQARILEGFAHALLQEIFPTQGSNPCLYIYCIGKRALFHWHHLGSPSVSYQDLKDANEGVGEQTELGMIKLHFKQLCTSRFQPEESSCWYFGGFPLEKEMATHSIVLAWRIPGTGEPGGLPSMGSHRVGHD